MKCILCSIRDGWCSIWAKTQGHHFDIADLLVQSVIAIAAIFGYGLHRFLNRPKLRMEFKNEPPYRNETVCENKMSTKAEYESYNIMGTVDPKIYSCSAGYYYNIYYNNISMNQKQSSDNYDNYIPTISYKLKIANKGRGDAKNVQVYLVRLCIYDDKKDEEYICNNVLPMNLMWAYQDINGKQSPIAKVISPKSEKYCDFIFVDKDHCYLRTEANGAAGDITNKNILPKRYSVYFDITTSGYSSVRYRIDFTYKEWNNSIEEVISVNGIQKR